MKSLSTPPGRGTPSKVQPDPKSQPRTGHTRRTETRRTCRNQIEHSNVTTETHMSPRHGNSHSCTAHAQRSARTNPSAQLAVRSDTSTEVSPLQGRAPLRGAAVSKLMDSYRGQARVRLCGLPEMCKERSRRHWGWGAAPLRLA